MPSRTRKHAVPKSPHRYSTAPVKAPVKTKIQLGRGDLLNVIEVASDVVLVIDSSQDIALCNEAATRLFGYEKAEIIGLPFSALLPARTHQDYEKCIAASLDRSGAIEYDQSPSIIRCMRCDGTEFDAEVSRSLVHAGGWSYTTVIMRDITARLLAQKHDAHRLAIVSTLADGVISIDSVGSIETWNETIATMSGHQVSEVMGRSLSELALLDNCPIVAAMTSRETHRTETSLRTIGNRLVPVSVTATPMLSSDGHLLGVSAVIADITQRKQREDNMRFVMMELAHRAKNLMAVILSMAKCTSETCSTVDEFEAKFASRVHSLAHSHDLLLKENWSGASLKGLFERQLSSFLETSSKRVAIRGPAILLKPQAAQMIGLAIHELATNAAKHGALSNRLGRIDVVWWIALHSDGGKKLSIEWKESGGPEVTPPTREGFGFMVVNEMVGRALDAAVSMAFNPEGFKWRVVAPENVWCRPEVIK